MLANCKNIFIYYEFPKFIFLVFFLVSAVLTKAVPFMMEEPSEEISRFNLPFMKNNYFATEVERSNGMPNQDYFNLFDTLYSYT